jgi:hypothetical protein
MGRRRKHARTGQTWAAARRPGSVGGTGWYAGPCYLVDYESSTFLVMAPILSGIDINLERADYTQWFPQ